MNWQPPAIWSVVIAVVLFLWAILWLAWALWRNKQEYHRIGRLLGSLAAGISGHTGDEFFRGLVAHFCDVLKADCAFVGELALPARDRVKTLGVFLDGKTEDNFEYKLEGTPCENVLTQRTCIYPSGVQEQFPKDVMLREMKIRSYIGTPILDAQGRVLGLLVVLFRRPLKETRIAESLLKVFATRAAAEVERKRAEKSLRESEEENREARQFADLLIDSSVDGILAFDHECRYTMWNSGMERITDMARSECLGKVAFDIFPFLKEIGEDYYFQQALGGNYAVARDRRFTLPDGREGFFEGHYSPIRDRSGTVVGGLAVIRDITERKNSIEALRVSERLVQENQMRLLSISHREQQRFGQDLHDGLGQHLTGIGLKAKALESRLTKEKMSVGKEAAEIKKLVREAIQMTRDMSRELFPVMVTEFGLVMALEELVKHIEDRFSVGCRFEHEPGLPDLSHETATHLFRIVQEAINNAIRHGQAKHIVVRLGLDRGRVLLAIEDDGQGISPLKEKSQGMGFHIMKARAEVVGAILRIQSEEKKGTIVSCRMTGGREVDSR
ncbi:MAG: PAS domain-containing protein [Candidatus Omnitrophota bacterium]|nr:PAS domain-containing protein [Candidatus Omnitrophota bacterium]